MTRRQTGRILYKERSVEEAVENQREVIFEILYCRYNVGRLTIRQSEFFFFFYLKTSIRQRFRLGKWDFFFLFPLLNLLISRVSVTSNNVTEWTIARRALRYHRYRSQH